MAVSNSDGVDKKRNHKAGLENAFVRLQHERRPAKGNMPHFKSNGAASSKPIAPLDVDSPAYQRCSVALRLLSDAYDYAQQLGRLCWDFAEEIDSLRQHGLTNGDLRWLVCSGFVEHGREVTELGQAGRKFDHERGLYFSNETCFVLSEDGASHVNNFLKAATKHAAMQRLRANSDELDDPEEMPNPTWDRERQELRVGKTVVKQFKVPARNQETILAVFQEEDWPVYIDDPLPRDPEIDPKRRLHDTINSLNRSQKNHLIQFRGNGSGQGVRWELIRHV